MNDQIAKNYNLIKANVINSSLIKADNYITLDKGSNDGVHSEMGVIDRNGVVGIVYMTTPKYSVVISMLNTKCRIGCKILGSGYFGTIKWEGRDSRYAYLDDLPRHADSRITDNSSINLFFF